MDIKATIKKVEYQPYLCRDLSEIPIEELESSLCMRGSCIVRLDDQNKLALSSWVSAKRTRSYPYARIYDTLAFSGRKVTVIPIYKDEGADGDRDFIQWDTISLMSLLGVYVIISYYAQASKNSRYANKITNQRFDITHIKKQIDDLRFFQSDALHWNLIQADSIGEVANLAFVSYRQITSVTGVKMHSEVPALERINQISNNANRFKDLSRKMSQAAQERESVTTQPKEFVNQVNKSTITIENYLGGEYYLTTDETWVEGNQAFLVECKHSKRSDLPSQSDIKDGLIKMVLFSNLDQVTINAKSYTPHPILRLTSSVRADDNYLTKAFVKSLLLEAEKNHFEVRFT
ncbi:MAG: hypothetical protein HPY76_13790 [Anaerolineae bacterium]|nr:hypothetical protein [Anaerolineae bacterium]